MNVDLGLGLETFQQILDGFVSQLPHILAGLVVLALAFLAGRVLKRIVGRLNRTYGRSPNLGIVMGRLAQWGTVALGTLVSFLIIFPSFSFSELIQLLGIGSLAVGLIFRSILEDYFAGILLLLQEPFKVDDQIILKDFEGTVSEIGTRASAIKTYDGRRIVIPNAKLLTNEITVNTAYPQRRIEVDIGIGYGDDPHLAGRLILEAVNSVTGILKDPPPEILMVELADFSIVLRVRWWIKPPLRSDALVSRGQILTAIREHLTTHGVDLPFPTQQILFHDQTEETDGDRRRQREGWPAGRDQVPAPARIATPLVESRQARRESGAND
ncbi:MAG: mechanosensitive ion channel family protein [Anaerolineae bacterium]|jgi:small conductance mechanosensitive channel